MNKNNIDQTERIVKGREFEKEVINLLFSCCSNDYEKSGVTTSDLSDRYYDVLVKNGIKSLNLKANTKIEIKRVNNQSNLKNLFLNSQVAKYGSDLVYILDIDRSGLESFLKAHGIRIKGLITFSELSFVASSKSGIRLGRFITSKSLLYENLADYITFCLRIKIISSFRFGHIISPVGIDGENNSFEYFDQDLLPFVYNDVINQKKYLFIKDFRYTKRKDLIDNLDEFDVIVKTKIQASNNLNEESFHVTYEVDGIADTLTISKISSSDLSSMLPLYNNNLGYGRGIDFPIYKYRAFQRNPNRKKVTPRVYKTRKEAINFINTNTYDSISNGTLWFSNKEQVNDPFDLDIRVPKSVDVLGSGKIATGGYDEKNSQYAIFCTSRTNDNILLWSHYGDSHKGICSEYSKNALLDDIDNDKKIALCIFGEVEYLEKRPDFVPMFSLISYVEFDLFTELFNIRCLFSKYSSWSYEREMRFAILPVTKDDFVNGYGGIKRLPSENYYGNRLDYKRYGVYFRTSHLNPVKTFDISNVSYLLLLTLKSV